jgi:hypothetical protein
VIPVDRPLALRTRLLLAIVVAVGLTLVLLIAVFNVALARGLDNDADEIVRARAHGERAALVVRDGAVVAPATAAAPVLDTRAWVFGAGGRALRSPPASPDLEAAARAHAAAPQGFSQLGDVVRLHALPVPAEG